MQMRFENMVILLKDGFCSGVNRTAASFIAATTVACWPRGRVGCRGLRYLGKETPPPEEGAPGDQPDPPGDEGESSGARASTIVGPPPRL